MCDSTTRSRGTFVATEDGDAVLHPTTQVPLRLAMKLVPHMGPHMDAAGAVNWTATFNLASETPQETPRKSMMKTLVENSTGWIYDDSYAP